MFPAHSSRQLLPCESWDILALHKIMLRRAILSLLLGAFSTALVFSAVAVYIFHDVDQTKVGHWNEAFAELAVESVLFSLLVGGSVWLLVLLGRRLFGLRGSSPRPRIGVGVGVAAAAFQYPFEYVGRRLAPSLSDSFLSLYLVLAILVSTAVLLADTFRQS